MENSKKLSVKKNYEILNKISEGNFGTVYKAINKKTNEIVAIKKVFTSRSNKNSRSMVEREIKILSILNHENVIKMYDYKLKETSVTMVLEYADTDLSTYLENSTFPINSGKIKNILHMILSGLSYLHSKQIIHRDLKPSNILLTKNGLLKIGDLGSATFFTDKKNGEFSIEGFSRWYKCPELLYGCRDYNYLVDIWSAACIFGEMLNGSPIFAGINEIDQLSRIASVLGSPNEKNWKSIVKMPDYGKINFKDANPVDLKKLFPNALDYEIDLLVKILRYDERLTANEALKHIYFKDLNPIKPIKDKYFEKNNNGYFNYMTLLD